MEARAWKIHFLFYSPSAPYIKVKIQVVSGQQVVEENHDSVAKTSLVLESFSESVRGRTRTTYSLEEAEKRKKDTTSLLLGRRKKIKTHTHTEPVLRLRGGGDKIDGMNSKHDAELAEETDRQSVVSLVRPS